MMLKLTGAGLIAAACVLASAIYIAGEKARIRELKEICELLRLMQGELETRLTPLPELIHELREKTEGSAKSFLAGLERELEKLGERDFDTIWAEAAETSFTQIEEGEREEVKKLGGVLGRYSLEIQLEQLKGSMDKLTERWRLSAEKAPERSRVGTGMICALGALLLIALA